MKCLIDANIILDVLQDRKPHVLDSLQIWRLCEAEQAEGYVSALSFANMVYVMRQTLDPAQVKDLLSKLKLIFRFADLCSSDLTKAAEMMWPDYEDAVQAATAERLHADVILTRNVRDFKKSPVPAFTPAEYLARYA